MIHVESRGDPRAISPKGAQGLMQLMPETQRIYGVSDPFDPVDNRRAGTEYVNDLMVKYQGDQELALMAYNWGPGNVDKWVKGGRSGRIPAETRKYLDRLLPISTHQGAMPPLPNGAVLNNDAPPLPAGAVLEGGEAPASAEGPDDDSEFIKGLVGSIIGTNPKMAGNAIEGLGVLVESDTLQTWGNKVIGWSDKQLEDYRADTPSFTDIADMRSLLGYMGFQAGTGLGSAVPSLVVGTGVGLATANPIAGVIAGAVGPSFIQNYGDVYSGLKDELKDKLESGEIDRKTVAGVAVLAGIPMAALDVITPAKVIGGALKPAKDALRRNIIKRVARGIATGMAAEGITEFLQAGIAQWTQAYMADADFATKERFVQMIDEGFAGALGGGIIGGAGGTVQARPAPPREDLGKEPPQESAPLPEGAVLDLEEPAPAAPEGFDPDTGIATAPPVPPAAAAETPDMAAPPEAEEVITKVEEAAAETETAPTEPQKEAGNYKKGKVNIQGLEVSIETPAGAERTGVDRDGESWSVTMPAHYGYVKRTEGADGEQVDVYIGDRPDSDVVYVVDQLDLATGKFDEHKAILGATSRATATQIYDEGFSDGKGLARMGAMTEVPMDKFKRWLETGDQNKPMDVNLREFEMPPLPEGAEPIAETAPEVQEPAPVVEETATAEEAAPAPDAETAEIERRVHDLSEGVISVFRRETTGNWEMTHASGDLIRLDTFPRREWVKAAETFLADREASFERQRKRKRKPEKEVEPEPIREPPRGPRVIINRVPAEPEAKSTRETVQKALEQNIATHDGTIYWIRKSRDGHTWVVEKTKEDQPVGPKTVIGPVPPLEAWTVEQARARALEDAFPGEPVTPEKEAERVEPAEVRPARKGPPAGEPAEDVRGIAPKRPAPAVPTERPGRGERPVRVGAREDDGRGEPAEGVPGKGRPARGDQADGGRGRPAPVRPAPERGGRAEPGREPEQRVTGAANYRITAADQIGEGGAKTKARDNLEAIRVLKEIEADGRPAAVEEQAKLARYVGWGGLVNAFPPSKGAELKPEWQTVGTELAEILTDEEYASARASTPNAHYTSPEVIEGMWGLLRGLDFRGGRVLEPGMGVGHFFGLMPDDLLGPSHLHGVELDSITGRIAKQLYPNTDIRVEGFQDATYPENYFDLAVGNVPFADVVPFDPVYNKSKSSLHDYFFLKSLELVKPGGYLAFITSRYSMDKQNAAVRTMLAEQADLVGAIRLPNNAFKGIANTEVTTDIIVLRKRKPDETVITGPKWAQLAEIETPDGPARINEYFAKRPEMMAGHMRLTGTMYGGKEPALEPTPGADLGEHLGRITDAMREDAIDNALLFDPEVLEGPVDRGEDLAEAPDAIKEGAYYVTDDKLYIKQLGRALPVPRREGRSGPGLGKTDFGRVKHLAGIRDAMRDVLTTQMRDVSEQEQEAARKNLNRLYDAFVKRYGPVNKTSITEIVRKDGKVIVQRRQPNLRAFSQQDPDAMSVGALEVYDEIEHTAEKAGIFTERVIRPEREIRSVETVEDSLLASLNQHNRVDTPYMAQLLGQNESEVIAALKGQIYLNPETGAWDTADAYLSGNVRAKLTRAEVAAKTDQSYTENVEALRAVQPEDLLPSEISVRLGAPWIPKDDIVQFTAELLDGDPSKVSIFHDPKNAAWGLNAPALGNSVAARKEWGTDEIDAVTLISLALNLRRPEVTKTVYEDGNRKEVKDPDSTLAAEEKQQRIKDRFSEWIWEDFDRGERLARMYNDRMNNIRLREFDGSHLTFPGMKEVIPGGWFKGLHPHQKNAVWRIMQNGNTLLAHAVGAGKTMEMVAAGMEMKRVGLINKPMTVVPNHMLEQFSRELLQLYPNAQILVADETQFHTKRRRQFVAKVATGNWDAIIIKHSAFSKIPLSAKTEAQFVEKEIDEYEALVLEAKADGESRTLVKRLEKAKQRLEERLKQLSARRHKDRGITFEETGIDFLFVDELHEFKNLMTLSKIQNVKNLPVGSGAQKAWDLHIKVQYLEQLNPGRSLVGATATPISNSMIEAFTMTRYLRPSLLKERGMDHFDAWAGNFGEVVSRMELDPTGGTMRIDSRFAKFVNVPELLFMFREFADVKRTQDLGLKLPKIKGGKAQIIEAKPSLTQQAAVGELQARLEAIKGKRPEKGADNPLKIVNDGRHIALDARTRYTDATDHPGSKVNQAVDKIYSVWNQTKKEKLTQLVFLDLSTPSGGRRFSVYEDMRGKLIAKGVPEREVVFIHDFATDVKKARLFSEVRAGKVRILFGSTSKMGIGTNVQKRLSDIHHIDAPWRPSDIEQRDGRGLRQGNENEELGIWRYVTSGTFDAYMWQTLDVKHQFIQQIMAGELSVREMEDVDEDSSLLDPATVKAIASGNPLIMERATLEQEINKLSRLQKRHIDTEFKMQREMRRIPGQIEGNNEAIALIDQDIAARQETKGDAFKIVIEGRTYTKRKQAGQMLETSVVKAIDTIKARGPDDGTQVIGSFAGFDVEVHAGEHLIPQVRLSGKNSWSATTDWASSAGLLQSLEAAPRKMDGARQERVTWDGQLTKEQKDLKAQIGKPFDRAEDLAKAEERFAAVEAELAPKKEEAPPAPTEEDEKPRYAVAEELTDEFIERGPEIAEKLKAALGGMIPKAKLALVDELIPTGTPIPARAMSRYNLITVSLAPGGNPVTALRHEAIHVLRAMGLFKPAEWRQLQNRAKRHWRPEFKIDDRWAEHKLTDEQLDEEAVAEAFAHYQRREILPAPGFRRIFERIDTFLKRLGNVLKGSGFRTIEDVFANVETGKIGAREATKPATFQTRYMIDELMTEDERAALASLESKIGGEHKGIGEKLRDLIPDRLTDRLKQSFLDDLHAIKIVEMAANAGKLFEDARSAYKLARLSRGINDVIMDAMAFGAPEWQSGTTVINTSYKAPLEILEELGDRVDLFEKFLVARRARELESHPKYQEKLLDEEEIAAALKLGQIYPEFQTLAKEWNEYNEAVLRFAERSGLLDEATMDLFREMHRNYVPFHRIMEGGAPGKQRARMGFAGQHPNFWKIGGSKRNLERPFLAIEANIHRLIEASIKNTVMLRTAELNAETGDSFMERIGRQARKVFINNEQIIKDLEKQGLEVLPEDAVDPDALRVLWSLGNKPRGDNIVSLVRNGRVEFYEVTDPMLFRSLSMLHRTRIPFIEPLRWTKHLLTVMVGLDPSFQFANFMRDTMHASVISHIGFKPVVGSIRGMKSRILKDTAWREFLQAGAGMSSLFEADRPTMHREVERRLRKGEVVGRILDSPKQMLGWAERVESTFEYSTRVGAFKKLREEGVGLMEAAYQARDISTDFAMRGDWLPMRLLAETVPFLNAGVQGLYRTARGAKEGTNAWYKLNRSFLMKASVVAIASIALYLHNREDPRFKTLNDYQRDTYWWFFIGDTPFKLPKPFEVGALFGTIPERMAELAITKEGEHFAQRLWWVFNEMFRLDVVPQLAKPPLRIYSNWDEFRERPVVPQWLKRYSPELQYDASTPLTHRALGTLTGTSPKKIETLVNGYLGAWGGYLAAMTDPMVRVLGDYAPRAESRWFEAPVVRRFIGPKTPYSTRYMKEFYEMRREADRLYADMQRLQAEGEVERANKLIRGNRGPLMLRDTLNKLNRQLQKINKAMRMIQNSRRVDMTPAEKRGHLDRLREQRNAMVEVVERLRPIFRGK